MEPLLPIFVLSLWILPFSISLATALSIYVQIRAYRIQNWPSKPDAVRKRVLLTGGDDGAILATARALRASGSTVYVVKQERIPHTNHLWTSKAVHKYVGLASGRLRPILSRLTKGTRFNFGLPVNLPGSILNLVESAKIDLWIQCDTIRPTVAQMQAKEIVLKHTSTKLFEPDIDTARLARGYSLFAHHMRHHETEVHCPKTVMVRSRAEIHDLLWKAPKGQQFLLERAAPIYPGSAVAAAKANSGTKRQNSGFDDSSTLVNDSTSDSDEFEGVETSTPVGEYIHLPLATPNATYSTVAAMAVSSGSPWIMHEVINGIPGTIFALVVNGKLRAFTARLATQDKTFSTASASSRSPLSSRKAPKLAAEHDVKSWASHEEHTNFVNPASTIGSALLEYAQRFAASLSDKPSTHLNLHFFLTDRSTGGGAEQKIVATGVDFNYSPVLVQQAIACGAGADFGAAITSGSSLKIVDETPLLLPLATAKRIAADVRQPIIRLPRASTARGESLNALAASLEEMINEADVRYDSKDLVPVLWFWLVQGPIEVAFEGLVELLENAEARRTKR